MAGNIAFNRIQRECRDVVSSRELEQIGITVEVLNENLSSLRGTINGPPDSSYEGGRFSLDIVIPESYPFQPPKVKFLTRIWHPNVSSQTGIICLDVLKDQWAASLTLRTVLLSVQALLTLPEPKDPQDAVVAKQQMENPALFYETAKFWTQHFANGPGTKNPEYLTRINSLREMGVPEGEAIAVLSNNDWSLARATEYHFR